jgi:hypothetical protein
MVDSHSLNSVSAPTSAFNFKSGDISGTAARTSDDKMGQGNEYFMQQYEEEEMRPDERFVDRSAQLKATLNSLAMMNVAHVIKGMKVPRQNQEDKKERKSKEVTNPISRDRDYESDPED